MKKWRVCYMDSEEDSCKVWVHAYDEDGAEAQARSEYWDIKSIVFIQEIKE